MHVGSLTAKGRTIGQESTMKGNHTSGDSVSLQKLKEKVSRTMAAAGIPNDLDWVAADSARSYYEMGTPQNTAQVHPYHFTTAMAELAEDGGAELILGSVMSIDRNGKAVKSVTYNDKSTSQTHTIPATDVIIAAGPWTRNIYPPAPYQLCAPTA